MKKSVAINSKVGAVVAIEFCGQPAVLKTVGKVTQDLIDQAFKKLGWKRSKRAKSGWVRT